MNSRKKIAIASVLKPIDDARNYKKIGNSLAQSGKYEVHVVGYPIKSTPENPAVTFHSLPHFSRLSLKRLTITTKILKLLIKVKPDIVISNTHENLIVILLYKILFGAKIIYDVQENYYLNILYSNAFPKMLRGVIAGYVRMKERIVHPFYDGIILAEKCYKIEMPFFKNTVIIENKSILPRNLSPKQKTSSEKIKLVYTGTIAEEYGIFDALRWVKKLSERSVDLEFLIMGYCPNETTRAKVLDKINNLDYIKAIGINTLVSHNEIIKEIKNADFAVLPYRTNTYYSNRVPTRIYECLSLKTPMIVRKNPNWNFLFQRYDAFLFTDFDKINISPEELFMPQKFFKEDVDSKDVMWDTEATKLLKYLSVL